MADEPLNSLKPIKPWMITKNVIVISFASMLNFTAFLGAVNLQSSINSEAGLGTSSLAAINTSVIFSNLFLSVGLIKCLGTKFTIPLALLAYMPYIAAQTYPTFYTMIPAAILLGLGAGPLSSATFTHISVCAEAHSKISKLSVEETLMRFFGMYFMIHQMNQVWGNLISSLVLTSGYNSAAVTSVNESLIPIMCGAEFLPSLDSGEALPPQPPEKIYMLSGIYIAFIAGAILISTVGLDSLNRFDCNRQRSRSKKNNIELWKLMKNPTQLLLIFINIFIGMEQAFFGVNFASAFVACAVGTGYIGFVFMVLGLFNALGSLLMRHFAKVVRRFYLISTATFIHTALLCTMLLWHPHVEEIHILYIIAAFWGICDSIWLLQMNAYYAFLFPGREEATFSICLVWQSVGFILMYIISPYMVSSSKTYLLLVTMFVGVLGYVIVEYQQSRIKKKNENKKDSYIYTSINS